MKAVVFERYGSPDVLHLKEVESPTPGAGELLIKVRATTVTSGDRRVRSLDVPFGFGLLSRFMFGFVRPKQPILGTELAGDVVSVGRGVDNFKVGDPVFAINGMAMGAHAEYTCVRADGPVALKPSTLSYDEAAALSFGGTTALSFLRRAKLGRGEHVLIHGASGAVGTAAVQLAKYFGAVVTGVCSTGNLELVRDLGADHVIDYTRDDYTKNGQAYDVIVDTVGTATYARCTHSLKPGGRLLLIAAGLPQMLSIPWVSATSRKRIIAGPAPERAEDVRLLAELAQAGTYRPVIDRRYRFEEIPEAHRYVDTGRKRGNVVVTLDDHSM